MIAVPAILTDGVLRPETELPQGIAVLCDGKTYTVYEEGDDLPPILEQTQD
ncbi:hypothetical protein [uncultured Pseudacidovorax sp.]|uniref:hypothetical protein n=1 Tax=uncultured Pseudacidovorax sp. TaxID=679313 RepID=UPI0025CF9F9D|nr:hypothetical protein [uncultured Pseudacidovorax sp.]